jgi:hypothetical protein
MKKSFSPLSLLIILSITALAYGNPEIQNLRIIKDTIGQYEKFEAVFDLNTVYNNPFDPEEIDIMATYISPAGKKWNIPAFYYYAHSLWMIRFSPDETGSWTFYLNIKDKTSSAVSQPDTFRVVSSGHHGPLHISPDNHRYLEHTDGTPFYGVGLWYNSALMPPGWG